MLKRTASDGLIGKHPVQPILTSLINNLNESVSNKIETRYKSRTNIVL